MDRSDRKIQGQNEPSPYPMKNQSLNERTDWTKAQAEQVLYAQNGIIDLVPK